MPSSVMPALWRLHRWEAVNHDGQADHPAAQSVSWKSAIHVPEAVPGSSMLDSESSKSFRIASRSCLLPADASMHRETA